MTIKRSNQKKKKESFTQKMALGIEMCRVQDRDFGSAMTLIHGNSRKEKRQKGRAVTSCFSFFWRGGAVALCGLAICRDDYCGW